ncbi:hypothetical protein [Pseudobacillus wudalianchiensis]|uniref:Uncharacterized protein n=1 Tax=Pseudobacillus wudalianchiensis TaxID=1743143 RepID=A0A1B9B725_9BACI|nr:hypothetical protein [Bacillus wudalianchiensis]OCA91878.1 hypothetical protein A8F95_19330 [Bacillus wudalianchiensis]
MNMYDNFDHKRGYTRRGEKRGCLTWTILLTILLLVPIVSFGAKFIYETAFRERLLVISHSPHNVHKIEVFEKGAETFFRPSTVRIKHSDSHIDCHIRHDGSSLQPSNVSVTWKNEKEATITLTGDGQTFKTIEFKVTNHEEDSSSFQEVQRTSSF